MELLPKWVLPPTLPSVYESESFTVLEMVSKLYGAVNTLIEEYNKTVEELGNFKEGEKDAREVFETNLTKVIRQFMCDIESQFSDLEGTATRIVNEAIQAGNITVTEKYDPATESLNIIVGGEI